MADDINTLFEQLLPFQWKSVPVPTSKFTMALRHDLVQHKYPGRDGANVEDTGRAPYHFTASIPFLNGTVPGKGETWGILYPTQYRLFMSVAAKGATGILVHPEFGEVACKLESCETVWSAERRDGVVVECSWLETIIPGDTVDLVNSRPSPVASVLLGALDLDAQLGTITPPFPKQPVYTPDFAASMRSLTAVADSVTLASQRGLASLGGVFYRLNTLQNAIDNAQAAPATTVRAIVSPDTTAAARRALLWPMKNTLEQFRGAANDLKQVLATSGKQVKTYITQIDMTLAAIAQNVGAPVADVIALNPAACASAVVPRATTIRYYAAA
jgi:prophage DNA circulation protein